MWTVLVSYIYIRKQNVWPQTLAYNLVIGNLKPLFAIKIRTDGNLFHVFASLWFVLSKKLTTLTFYRGALTSRIIAKLLLELNFQYKVLTDISQGWLLKALPGVNKSLQAGNFTATIFSRILFCGLICSEK